MLISINIILILFLLLLSGIINFIFTNLFISNPIAKNVNFIKAFIQISGL